MVIKVNRVIIIFIIHIVSHFSADQARNNSETIRNEGFRLIAEREDTTVKKQRDSDKRVGERLNDVSHWRSELQASIFRAKISYLTSLL